MNALDYRHRAEQHRPTDPVALAREVRRLSTQGLTERDIGQTLRLDPASVRFLLSTHPNALQETA